MNTIELKHPYQHAGVIVSILTLRRPKVRDVAAVEKTRSDAGDMAAGVHLTSLCSGLSVAAIEEMDAADFMAVGKALEGFTKDVAAPTGGNT